MIKINNIKLSKYLSYILRHKPEDIGLTLDSSGWASTKELISKINSNGKYKITMSILEEIVRTDDKQRYAFNDDKSRIRANQGHSFVTKIQYTATTPPEFLYHGTSTAMLDTICRDGIKPMKRQYVHLSEDLDTAFKVGKRHGNPVVIIINARALSDNGTNFYLADNGVWLTDYIGPNDLFGFSYPVLNCNE